MKGNFATSSEPFFVRRFEAGDREAVLALWPAAVMHSLPGSETIGVLINAVEGAIDGKDHVWVAEASGRIIGSATVIRTNACLAHLRFLSVAPDFAERHVVARGLVEVAIRDAYERGYLKLVVHTDSPPSRPTALLHELGFEFTREHSMGGEHVLEFYQNLYERLRTSSPLDGQNDVASWRHD
jgi:N-acetylglutamate synthase-like GNAT family acetyltransferase